MNQKKLDIIKKSFDEKKNSHAFLVETNNIEYALNEIKNLIFDINNVEFIKEENVPDIKIIRPLGKEIKREQIGDILEEFKTFPVLLKHRYYIILQSDVMNQSSANTILKFLEEPDGDVIGFFITSNKGAMINTIVSRCQHYKLIYDVKKDININKVLEFLKCMDINEVYKRIIFLNGFIEKDRNDNIKIFREIKEYLFQNKTFNEINSVKLLVKRVSLLDNVIERLLKNANQELVIVDLARNWK